jgi:hypothetical protein
LVKIEGPVWYNIYHHLPVVKGGSEETPLFSSTNQWENKQQHDPRPPLLTRSGTSLEVAL